MIGGEQRLYQKCVDVAGPEVTQALKNCEAEGYQLVSVTVSEWTEERGQGQEPSRWVATRVLLLAEKTVWQAPA